MAHDAHSRRDSRHVARLQARIAARLAARHAADGEQAEGDGGPVTPPSETRSPLVWRIATPVVFVVAGGLFVVSAESSDGTDLRPGGYADIARLVQDESGEVNRLTDRAATLKSEVEGLTLGVADLKVDRLQRQVDAMKGPAGLEPVAGPGVTVTLSDAPAEVIDANLKLLDEDNTIDVNYLVVHQQDIQAVVNAMWKGGADAVTIQGQRVVSTTGIKCAGNAVRLQGVPYPQPYTISAVGNQGKLLASIENDEYLGNYRKQAERPDVLVGWDLEAEREMVLPGYDGLLDLTYASTIG